jgi:hypothetical protein
MTDSWWPKRGAARRIDPSRPESYGMWFRCLRSLGIRPRKACSTRHTFIAWALSEGANMKGLAEYCGTSVAVIERSYGRFIRGDYGRASCVRRLAGALEARPFTFPEGEPMEKRPRGACTRATSTAPSADRRPPSNEAVERAERLLARLAVKLLYHRRMKGTEDVESPQNARDQQPASGQVGASICEPGPCMRS